jgi:sugar lactone lactonase YvrE
MMKRLQIAVIAIIVFSLSSVALAQDAPELPPLPGEIFIGDLIYPYGLSFDDAGNLWFTEGGNGDEDGNVNFAGAVMMLNAEGETEVVFPVPSFNRGAHSSPLYRVFVRDGVIWIILAGNSVGLEKPVTPFENAVIAIDQETHHIIHWIDTRGYELANDPDGRGELHSNPTDLAWDADGLMYIVDAGANTLYTWTPEGGLNPVQSWDNDVPTSLEFDANGDLFIGFLGAGLAPGAGKIEQWSGGELVNTYGDLTTVTDILLEDNGDILAVQMLASNEEGSGLGSVVRVVGGFILPFADNLPYPNSIARSADGEYYVSINAANFGPRLGPGAIVRLDVGE